jgi:ADP-heptose:LPS heptosyltransferase
MGDTLMLMPAISSLKKRAEIIIAGRRPGIDYLRPYVARCMDMETSGWHMLFREGTENIPDLSLPAFDHVVAFLNDPDCKLILRLKAFFPESKVSVFPVFPPQWDATHMALYMARSVQDSTGLPLNHGDVFEDAFRKPIMIRDKKQGEKQHIVIHPGSGSIKKNHPPEFWLKLIKELRRSGFAGQERFTLLLGPAEEGLLQFFKENLKKDDTFFKVMPEREELLSILSNASVYIGHDSGITHLAAMLGIHVIAIFKESPIERWRPLGPNVHLINNSD